MPSLHGHLISNYFAETLLASAFEGRLGEASRDVAHKRLTSWWRRAAALGPASSVRSIFDSAAAPLAGDLGFQIGPALAVSEGQMFAAPLLGPRGATVALLVTRWGENLDCAWREGVRQGIRARAPWCLCFNARQVRIVDARRSYARRFLEFDLETALDEAGTFVALWGLLRAEAFAPMAPTSSSRDTRPLFDRVVEMSARHAAGVSVSLQRGVLDALVELLDGLLSGRSGMRRMGRGAAALSEVFEQSLTIVYRILFLLFAEAHGLVPVWHPVYRDSYTIEALRVLVDSPGRARGLWEALQAISRLAHRGCHAGDLEVTPFNGRLFAPARTPLAETATLDDEVVRRALVALSTSAGPPGAGRVRIAYRDLGVEQLGAVYESVLDYEPYLQPDKQAGPGRAGQSPPKAGRATSPRVGLRGGTGLRKATGTFYTPRSITDYLVRRTLHPLVDEAAPDTILGLRVLDPAMGSGAFLVAACRYLAAAYESALIRDGACHASDIGERDRATFRRTIAQRCLYGVDRNPMAVQLARLSLWLATLAADRPLTFLDHHLSVGDSLVGASLDDIARRPPPRSSSARARAAPASLPLFEAADLHETMRGLLPTRAEIATDPGDTVMAVREKEHALARLAAPESALTRWKRVADLWCACWFWDEPPGVPSAGVFAELSEAILRGRSALTDEMAAEWLDRARRVADRQRFLHWTLEFPEVFFGPDGRPLPDAGFDAVLGNPPWDMIRADNRGRADRAGARLVVERLTRFARGSGIYTAQSDGHANQFQLFVERAISLTRRGGRVGLVTPWGLAADRGCAALRRLLLERCQTDSLVSLDNRAGIFPVHRSLRFLLLTSTAGGSTDRIRCRFGEQDPDALETLPDGCDVAADAAYPVVLTPALVRRLSSDDLAIPDLRSSRDLAIVDKLATHVPPLGSAAGWGARFGRELNASDDRHHFLVGAAGLPVLEGKQIGPFHVDVSSCRWRILEETAAALMDPDRSFRRARLAYRDVASATNRLTLIAAIVPADSVTTHTLFCLKTPLDADEQAFLCGAFNSFVANYLVRQRVTSHVTVAIVERLPLPRPPSDSAEFREVVRLARELSTRSSENIYAAGARLQALMARLYGLSRSEFAHVLATFPLVDPAEREAALATFEGGGPEGPPLPD